MIPKVKYKQVLPEMWIIMPNITSKVRRFIALVILINAIPIFYLFITFTLIY